MSRSIDVQIDLVDPVVAGAEVRFSLDRWETDPDGFHVASDVTATTDESGRATASLWPNGRGTRGSAYRVSVTNQGRTLLAGTAVFPADVPQVALVDYLQAPPYPVSRRDEMALAAAASQAARAASESVAAGADGSLVIEAATAINGHRVVATDVQGNGITADIDNPDCACAVFGISDGAVAAGAPIALVANGHQITFEGWAWRPGSPVYLGRDGAVSLDPGDGTFVLQVGVALTPITLRVGIQIPIFQTHEGAL